MKDPKALIIGKKTFAEFNADLKLYNFGTIGIANIDLIDTVTLDAFSNVEGSAGHHVDGVLLEQGQKTYFSTINEEVIFNSLCSVKNGKK